MWVAAADDIAKWSGTGWSALSSSGGGNGSLSQVVTAIAVSGNSGVIYALCNVLLFASHGKGRRPGRSIWRGPACNLLYFIRKVFVFFFC